MSKIDEIQGMLGALFRLVEREQHLETDLKKVVLSVSTPGFTIAYIPDGQRYLV